MLALQLRAEYPVFDDLAYLNAGTCGPTPRAATAAVASLNNQAERHGRTIDHFVSMSHLQSAQRDRYARLLGAQPSDVALTTSTSEGIVRVLQGLEWHRGDQILIAEQEHPGLLGPLAALVRRYGVVIRAVPLERIVEAVETDTKLVACSHVRWTDGAVAPAGLRELRGQVPVLIDGAQSAGAIPIDLDALGCAFYAAPGQKWLCGPIGTGMLWIDPKWQPHVFAVGPTYENLAVPAEGLDAEPWPDARAHDTSALSAEASAAAVAAFDVLDDAGWPAVHERATSLAVELGGRLADAGRRVATRGHSTLVSWSEADPSATRERLADAGVIVRDLPGTDYLRASVGAWSTEADIERLIAVLP